MNTENIIQFKELTKRYGNHTGVDNLDFTIKKGEIFGFLGPNGSGKTTSIRLMLDLLKPTSGSIEIFGENANQESIMIRKRCGYLPGNFSPYEKMKGEEFLRFSSHMRNLSYSVPTKLIDSFELSKTDLGKQIREYSQGMKQKIGIIQAIVHQPELIILDEPSTGLDPLMQDVLYDLLIELNNQGCSIFFSSHNLPEVEKICQKVGIIKEGKLVGFESLDSLRKKINRKMKLKFSTIPENPPKIPGCEFISKSNHWFEYQLKENSPKIIPHLDKLNYEEIVLPEPSLEDIFLTFYEDSKTEKDEK